MRDGRGLGTLPMVRSVYHLVRADLLERVRRFGFLLILGAMLLMVYLLVPPPGASYMVGLHPADVTTWRSYRGVYNSAWVGSIVAAMTGWLLSLLGFYLVRGAVERDRQTGVGQLIAASPSSKVSYVVGKWMSNVAVLSVAVGTTAMASGVMQLIRAEEMRIQLGELMMPFLCLTMPPLVLVAALCILFETLPGLRGGLGNAVYALAWVIFAVLPVGFQRITGLGLIEPNVLTTLRDAHPGGRFEASYGINPAWAGRPHTFRWEGILWTPQIILGRMHWVGVALVLVALAVVAWAHAETAVGNGAWWRIPRRAGRREEQSAGRGGGLALLARRISLAPLPAGARRFRFAPVLRAELRLALRRQPWWWYVGALGWAVGGLLAPADVSRQVLLPAAWLWPLLIWSAMGTREARYRTEELVFCNPHPLRRHLPAIWLSGVAVAMLTGSGVVVRLVLGGEWSAVLAWAVGAMFIPTLALALGVWTGSGRALEGLYAVLWYVGPVNQVAALDYVGATDEAIAAGVPFAYLALTVLLLALATLGRQRQLRR